MDVTWEQEEAVLTALYNMLPEEYRYFSCNECNARITTETGWQPRMAFVGNPTGTHRLVVDILCGECKRAGKCERFPR